jgi:hypothetical protein
MRRYLDEFAAVHLAEEVDLFLSLKLAYDVGILSEWTIGKRLLDRGFLVRFRSNLLANLPNSTDYKCGKRCVIFAPGPDEIGIIDPTLIMLQRICAVRDGHADVDLQHQISDSDRCWSVTNSGEGTAKLALDDGHVDAYRTDEPKN